MAERNFLAIDLGAESGRAILGHLVNDRLALEEVHRFSNGPVQVGASLHWDVLRLWSEIQTGLRLATSQSSKHLASIGVDTWGVDFALLDKAGRLLGNPYHYRDSRTNGMLNAAFQRVPRHEIYNQTGIQFMQLNSLYQLFAMHTTNDPALDIAETFLNMPDLFNFWLCGRKANEFTIATTTQCYDTRRGSWALGLLQDLHIPAHIFLPPVRPGVILDQLSPAVAQDAACTRLPVVAVGSHDTASAVAAVPAEGPDFIYISSGTWSLIGIEIDNPIVNESSLAYDLTNEGGVGNKFCFLKNIMGMWLLQECRREWARQGSRYSWNDLTSLADTAQPLQTLIFPGDSSFLAPGEMVGRIQAFCRNHAQPVPETHAAIVRCVLESLALEYRWTAEKLKQLSGKSLPTIHIIGGGSRNCLLNQFTADATGCQVVAGPVEATALGNILVQAQGLGYLGSLAEGRAMVQRSFDVSTFEPGSRSAWDEAYSRYITLQPRQ